MRQDRHEWSDGELILISQICVILHNMIVKMVWNGQLSDDSSETPLTSSTSEGDDVSGVSPSESPLLDEFFLCDENSAKRHLHHLPQREMM